MMLYPVLQKPPARKLGIRYVSEEVWNLFSSSYVLSMMHNDTAFKSFLDNLFESESVVLVEDTLMTKHELNSLKEYLKQTYYETPEKRQTVFRKILQFFFQ